MVYAIFGLLFIVLIVFAVLSAKNWHWVNIVFLILTFIAGVLASGALAQSLHLRRTNMLQFKNATKELEKQQQLANQAIYGSDDSVEYDRDCLRGVDQELERELLGRGRIWAGATAAADGDGVSLTYPEGFSFPKSATGESEMIAMVVYAFADGGRDVILPDGSNEILTFPETFVGTYKVAGENATTLQIEPIFVSNTAAVAELGTTTWSLYEKMPLDHRDSFRKAADLPDDVGIAEYREVLEQYLTPAIVGLVDDPADYEALIDRYAFDGRPIGEIQQYAQTTPGRINTRFEPPIEERFYEFRFDKKLDEKDGFDVDGTGKLEEEGAFSALGGAIDPALKLGRKVGFAKDETVLIDGPTAVGYQRAGEQIPAFKVLHPEVTEIGQYYFRKLNDYPYQLSQLELQIQALDRTQARIKAENDVTDIALQNTQDQVSARQSAIDDLRADQQNLEKDLQVIELLNGQRSQQLQEMDQRIQMLEQELKSNYRQLRGENP